MHDCPKGMYSCVHKSEIPLLLATVFLAIGYMQLMQALRRTTMDIFYRTQSSCNYAEYEIRITAVFVC